MDRLLYLYFHTTQPVSLFFLSILYFIFILWLTYNYMSAYVSLSLSLSLSLTLSLSNTHRPILSLFWHSLFLSLSLKHEHRFFISPSYTLIPSLGSLSLSLSFAGLCVSRRSDVSPRSPLRLGPGQNSDQVFIYFFKISYIFGKCVYTFDQIASLSTSQS